MEGGVFNMKFGLIKNSFKFDLNGLTITLIEETKINLQILSNYSINHREVLIPIEYDKEDILSLQEDGTLSDLGEAHYMTHLDWSAIFPQFSNFIGLQSIYLHGTTYLLGDYSEGKINLRVLIEIGNSKLNIYVVENKHLKSIFFSSEYDADFKLEGNGYSFCKTNTNRQYFV